MAVEWRQVDVRAAVINVIQPFCCDINIQDGVCQIKYTRRLNKKRSTGAANKPCVFRFYFDPPYLRLEMSFSISFTAQNNLQVILYLMGIEIF